LVTAAALISRVRWIWPRRSLAAIAVLGLLGSFVSYWLELDILNKPGVRAAAALISSEGSAEQPVVVSSSFIYFSVNYYLTQASRPEPKLLSGTTELIHFAGGPILKTSDIITSAELSRVQSDILWVVDTSGFGGAKASLGHGWRVADEKKFPEIFPHQGDIFVTKYIRQ